MELSDLTPAEWNPREIDALSKAALTSSLESFGDISGIVYSTTSKCLVAGHQRVAALRERWGDALRMEDGVIVTPDGGRFVVRVVEGWSRDQEVASNIAANSPHLSGRYTDKLRRLTSGLRKRCPELVAALRLNLLSGQSAATMSDHPVPDLDAEGEDNVDELPGSDGLKEPFPYFGGKDRVAGLVWQALGQPDHYIEPFFGSGAALLNRPNWQPSMTETVNDADGHVANVWRALQAGPDEVAKWCDWPVNHADLIARKARLNAETAALLEKLCADDAYYDAKLAGYWVWAASCWIGSGLISPNQIPHMGGKGVHAKGQIPHIGHGGRGVHATSMRDQNADAADVREPYNVNLYTWFRQLSERLRNVRVVCGDWTRVCGGNWQANLGTCGIFFDPPYSDVAKRDSGIYSTDSESVAHDVREWCRERAANPRYRIVLAGYIEEHESLLGDGWTVKRWSATGGYANMGNGAGLANRHREALFFSPHCVT